MSLFISWISSYSRSLPVSICSKSFSVSRPNSNYSKTTWHYLSRRCRSLPTWTVHNQSRHSHCNVCSCRPKLHLKAYILWLRISLDFATKNSYTGRPQFEIGVFALLSLFWLVFNAFSTSRWHQVPMNCSLVPAGPFYSSMLLMYSHHPFLRIWRCQNLVPGSPSLEGVYLDRMVVLYVYIHFHYCSS